MDKLKVSMVEDFISKDKIPDAFKYLLSHVNNSVDYNSLKEEILIKKSLFTKIESDNRKGIIDKDTYFRQRSIISHVLLSVSYEIYTIEKVEDEISDANINPKTTQISEEVEKLKDRIVRIEETLKLIEEKIGIQVSNLFKDRKPIAINNIGQVNKQISLTKQNLTIEDPKVNYVVVFGRANVGKSTILAYIAKYLHENYPLKYNSIGNKKGVNNLQNWLKALNENSFPKTTGIGNIEEMDISIEDPKSGNSTIITFLDISGEDLVQIGPTTNETTPKSINLKTYFEGNDCVNFLIVTTPISTREDDLIIKTFTDYLSENYSNTKLNIGLIINKWDLMQKRDNKLSDLVKETLPLTYNSMISNKDINLNVFKFSAIEDKYISPIVEYLLEEFKTTPNNVQSSIASIRQLLRLH